MYLRALLYACIVALVVPIASAIPLSTVPVFNAANPDSNRVAQTAKIAVRGSGTTDFYYLEADATTGALPVTLTGSSTVTANQGTQGLSTSPWFMNLRNAGGTELGIAATPLRVDPTGTTTQPISAAALPLPAGAATSALQTTGNTSLSSIDGKTPSLGQALMAASSPVVIASNQSAVPASQSGTWTVQPGNTANTTPWLNTINQGGNSATVSAGGALKVDGSAATQPVSGTVTANQGGAPWTVTGTGTAGSAAAGVLTVQGIASMTALKVDGSAVTQPVSGTVSAAQSGTWTVQPGNTANTTAWKVDGSAVTQPISGAVSQSGTWTVQPGNTPNTTAWLTTQAGHSYSDSARLDYSSTNVTTAAWVQLIASTAAAVTQLYIDDTCGQVLELGTGAAASETRKLIIPRGGFSSKVELAIPAGTRISLKAITATCSVGDITLTGLN